MNLPHPNNQMEHLLQKQLLDPPLEIMVFQVLDRIQTLICNKQHLPSYNTYFDDSYGYARLENAKPIQWIFKILIPSCKFILNSRE